VRFVLSSLALALASFISAAVTRAETQQACENVADLSWQQAIVQSQSFIAKAWVQHGPDWHVAFDSAPVARNPFALEKDATAAPQSRGFVWARDVVCGIKPGDEGSTVRIAYTAKAIRFSQDNKSWSKPQKNGILVALELTLKNGNWTIAEKSSEFSVLLPDAVLGLPKADELPNSAAWPDNRCRAPKHWEGKTCVASISDALP
jgi:hypothetical protein